MLLSVMYHTVLVPLMLWLYESLNVNMYMCNNYNCVQIVYLCSVVDVDYFDVTLMCVCICLLWAEKVILLFILRLLNF